MAARTGTRSWLTQVGALALAGACALGLCACQSDNKPATKSASGDSAAAASTNKKAPQYDLPPIRGITEMGLTAVWGSGANDVEWL